MSDPEIYNAIGDTAAELHEACETLIRLVEKCNGDDDGMPIGTFMHHDPAGGKMPWIVMAGPANVVCESATKAARDTVKKVYKVLKEEV